ncbi:DUF3048 domain-containing protein [Cryobacterium tagatosivorans]|uniref:DUF3048 domain-containing protein n=1 Tax=Cryobacterium tagatosivorans TaxID=1259199 RepID=A0A4V3I6A3_9MICO|nr:DUF3048 domain-containing protein [Cryobacterium tagatosivorans]TFB48891.1 DUF3048 domain-containing protein [Cryobacterium tagatosivorans]
MTENIEVIQRGRPVAVKILAAVIPVLLLAACTAEAPRPSATAKPTATEKAWVSTYTPPAATELAPLRGTAVGKGKLKHPSLAVKIDNHEAARPQIALERADIVFEELVEGGLTRYAAIWQSDIPPLIGPVRSIRPMDPDIISPFGGIVAYSGGQKIFVDMMQKAPVVNAVFDYDRSGLFYRIGGKSAPHNVVVKATTLVARYPKLAKPVQQFAYAPSVAASSAVVDGKSVSIINTRFSDQRWPSWAWNIKSKAYLRSQEGHVDRDSNGAQLKSTNVVIMRVGISHVYGPVPKTVVIGSGEAWVSTGGRTIHATWSKKYHSSSIRLVDNNGVTIRLAPGNTWIELVPKETGSVELVR